jgi:hypothetical protein
MPGNNPASNFPTTAPPKFFDNGSGAKLLQPNNQAPLIAAPTDLATSIVAINAIIAALVNAGIASAT